MAKQPKQFKRTIDKSGNPRYFYGGKRIPDKKGRSMYVKRSFDTIRPEALKPKELSSYKRAVVQKSLDRYRGRPLPKLMSYVFRDVLKIPALLNLPPGPVDFSKILTPDGSPVYPRYSDILRTIDEASQALLFSGESSWGAPGFRGRTELTSVADIVDNFSGPAFSGASFRVLLPWFMGGGEVNGKITAFEAIARFEMAVTESVFASDRQNVAFIRFQYFPKIDFKGKMVTFDLREKGEYLNARDYADVKYSGVSVVVQTSDPVKRTS